MSKHWKPDGNAVPLRPARSTRGWIRPQAYLPVDPMPLRRTLPPGARVGLVLVAAACGGLAFGAYQAFARPDVFGAPTAAIETAASASAVPTFSTCKWGGGRNCVVDGDTFYFEGDKVRIAGIDAPETHPPHCAVEARLGEAATEKLRALLNSGPVSMTTIDRDRDVYGRLLRNVTVDGTDVGEAMVGAGVAREYRGGRRSWC